MKHCEHCDYMEVNPFCNVELQLGAAGVSYLDIVSQQSTTQLPRIPQQPEARPVAMAIMESQGSIQHTYSGGIAAYILLSYYLSSELDCS